MRVFALPLLLLTLGLLSACSGDDTTKDPYANWTAKDFYDESHRSLDAGEFQTAIDYLENLEARFPFSSYSKQAQLDVAYAYYKFEEADSAIAAADRFIRLNPRDPHVAYAWYLKGITNFTRGQGMLESMFPRDMAKHDVKVMKDAFQDFSTLVRKYPDSIYAGDAYQRLVYLKNKLANHEVQVAQYYLKRQAWLAAARRAQYTLEHYQKTAASRTALEILVKAYGELQLPELASQAQTVLAANQVQSGQGEESLSQTRLDSPPTLESEQAQAKL